MASKIRWGILGNATIARKCVIPAIGRSRNGEVAVLGTRSPDDAGPLQKELGIPRLADDYGAVLADDRVDAVYIPLPNHLHLPWTLKALDRGKHVLCEKPLATNAREAQTMASRAEKADRLLMEAYMYRFHPRMEDIRRRIRNREIGNIRSIKAAFGYPMASAILEEASDFRLQPAGGGALLDVGCYGVSVARWFLRDEPDRVQALARYHANGTDLHLTALMGFGGDAIAVVEASFISALQQTVAVIGDKGAIELPHDAFIPWSKPARFTVRGTEEETGDTVVIAGADEYQLMVEAFADAVLKRRPLPFSPRESVRNATVMDALSRAARTGATETLQLRAGRQ
ncbi:MAG: Gfo/Idh/MocA family oxidoreductase [Desulfobacterales bacterium]